MGQTLLRHRAILCTATALWCGTAASACGGRVGTSSELDPVATSQRGGTGNSNAAHRGGTATTSTTSHPYVTGFDKIDLLLAVDNSLSMGDKQGVLSLSLHSFLRRLTNPDCVDPTGNAAGVQVEHPDAACPPGLEREFSPVRDIHVGVVTSSLGDFGGDTCPEDSGAQNLAMNDRAWLLGALPRTAGTLAAPFLAWSPTDPANYVDDMQQADQDLYDHISAATELGCGNEMQLESWYRFLVDPKPTSDVFTVNSAANQRGPVDQTIWELRRSFLRPDSLLAILMLTDENDCSMRDDTYGWVPMTAGGGFRMWRGSSACAKNPNDACCYSCMLDSIASDKCKGKDTACRQGDAAAKLPVQLDDINLRCRQTKRRFGYDFLFPPSRYVNALTKPVLCPMQTYGDLDCDCVEAKAKGVECNPHLEAKANNPLFERLDPNYAPTGPMRTDAQAVYLAGIVGVPWQDIARDHTAAILENRRADELNWDLFAPQANEDYATALLLDPLMLESTEPRTGRHPITGDDAAPPTAGHLANSINGHEWYTSGRDVQFACIFALDFQTLNQTQALRTCDLTVECGNDDGSDSYKICSRRFDGCACISMPRSDPPNPLDPSVSLTPLCQDRQNQYGNVQYFAKAYPGLRELQVLRGFYETTGSNNAVVGSICPKDLTRANLRSKGFGYNPTFEALLRQFAERLLKE